MKDPAERKIVTRTSDPAMQSQQPIEITDVISARRNLYRASMFFLPPSVLEITSSGSQYEAASEIHSTDKEGTCSYTLKTVASVWSALLNLKDSATNRNDKNNSGRGRLILAAVGAARSADALTLSQALINTLVGINFASTMSIVH